MNARDEILSRIQRSFPAEPRNSTDDHAAIPRTYVQSPALDPEARLELFEERLRDYGTEVYRCAPAQLRETIAQAMNAAGITNLLVADNVAPEWLPSASHDEESRQAAPEGNPAALSFLRDRDLSYDDLDRSQGILTTCAVAIALTGTIILRHSRDGRRALTLIPDYHLCIVRASQVVETVPEGIRAIDSPASSPLTLVSGPSATGDIEMTRIKGVHGPRRLAVILVLA
jgi:L-lactate dehydrogenase complex protein LldG